MKKIILSSLLLVMLIMAACAGIPEAINDGIPTDHPEEAEMGEISFIRSELERETDPAISEEKIKTLADENSAFAFAFYDFLVTEHENIIFSPISISIALSMTMAGAETITKEEMLSALQMTLPDHEIHQAFNGLTLAIDNSQIEIPEDIEGSEFQLNIANSIWGQNNIDFKSAFIDNLARNYGAGIYGVDFIAEPEPARQAINDWIADQTEEKILDLLPEGSIHELTRLVLANAIYFNGSWMYPFEDSATSEEVFTTLDDNEIMVEMMKLTGEQLQYYRGENYQAVNLPYLSTDFAMTVIVPDIGAFSNVENLLNPEQLTNITGNMSTERVDLQLPKFDFETTIDAKEPLSALGMAAAFDPESSDFSGMADVEDLHISDVLHKATINVDEQGTEAAAATAVIVGVTSAPIEEPISLIVDRPFLFFIRHNPSGSILFMGRVLTP